MIYGKLNIVDMTFNAAKVISAWKYEGIYSFYDQNGETEGFTDGNHYACKDSEGGLMGFFCFGEDGQIPTLEENVYQPGYLDIGLGLKPDLCGKGYGIVFIKAGLNFAKEQLKAEKIRLSVATFNERAIKAYKKAGFTVSSEVTNSRFNNKFYIMVMSL